MDQWCRSHTLEKKQFLPHNEAKRSKGQNLKFVKTDDVDVAWDGTHETMMMMVVVVLWVKKSQQ